MLASFPTTALVRPRQDFDELLARHAEKSGARLHERHHGHRGRCSTSAPAASSALSATSARARTSARSTFRAPLIAGLRRRLRPARAQHSAWAKRDDRPMGVAVRRYYRSPRTHDDYLECLPGALGPARPGEPQAAARLRLDLRHGRRHGNVGLGSCHTSRAYGSTDYRALLRSWLDGTPEEWGFREENAEGPVARRGAADGVQPHPALPPGHAAGRRRGRTVNPFNGEGIAYAMESGRHRGARRGPVARPARGTAAEKALQRLPGQMRQALGRLLPHRQRLLPVDRQPDVMGLATRHGLPRRTLMEFLLKLLANLYDPRTATRATG